MPSNDPIFRDWDTPEEDKAWEYLSNNNCEESTPSLKEYEKWVRYMAWCYDMHNLLTRLLDWIWKRIE